MAGDVAQMDAGPTPRRNPRSAITHSDPRGRLRLSNDKKLLPGVDGRTGWVRRCKDLIHAHVSDLGGLDAVTAAERSIVRRACVLSVELELLEAKFAASDGAEREDLDLYSRASSTLRRLLEAVGLQRRSLDVTPSVRDYVRHINDEQEGSDA